MQDAMKTAVELAARYEAMQAKVDEAMEEISITARAFSMPVATAATLKLAAMLASFSDKITSEQFAAAARLRFEDARITTLVTRECAAGGRPCPLHAGLAPDQRVH